MSPFHVHRQAIKHSADILRLIFLISLIIDWLNWSRSFHLMYILLVSYFLSQIRYFHCNMHQLASNKDWYYILLNTINKFLIKIMISNLVRFLIIFKQIYFLLLKSQLMFGRQRQTNKASECYHSPFLNNPPQSQAVNLKTLIEDIKYLQTCFTSS
jgi:hypothetical protein